MSILPESKDEWVALSLCPLKAWILLAWPFFMMARRFLYEPPLRWEFRIFSEILGQSYGFVGFMLLVGAAVQQRVCQRGHTQTLLYALAGIIFFLLHHA